MPVVFLHPVIVCKERAESWLSLDDKREGGGGLLTPQLQPGKMSHAFCFLHSETGTNSAIVLSCCIFATIVNSEQLHK